MSRPPKWKPSVCVKVKPMTVALRGQNGMRVFYEITFGDIIRGLSFNQGFRLTRNPKVNNKEQFESWRAIHVHGGVADRDWIE